ncbi:MAG: DUF748 domain-containing protein, partial [Micropepsaceae bacterium]
EIDWDGRVDAEKIRLASGRTTATQSKLSIDGRGKLEADGDMTATGSIAATATALTDEARKITVDTLKVGLSPLQLSHAGRTAWTGRIDLGGSSAVLPGIDVKPSQLSFDGRAEVTAGAAAPRGRLEGKLNIGRFRLQLADLALWMEHQAASGNALIVLNGDAAVPVTAAGSFSMTGVTAGSTRSPIDLLSLGRFEIDDARIGADGAATVSAVRVTKLQSIQKRRQGKDQGYPWRAELGRGVVTRIVRGANGDLTAAAADFDSLTLRVTNTVGGLLGLEALGLTPTDHGPPPKPAPSPVRGRPAAAPRVAIGHIDISGNSRIAFEDRVPSTPVRMALGPVTLRVDALDSARPAVASPVRLAAKIGDFSSVRVTGTARPFAAKLNLDMQAALTGFNLPALSPYAADLLGINLQTGLFDGDIAIKVVDEKLDGTTNLKISNLQLEEVAKGQGKLAVESGMPVETVVSLLRDGDGVINLRIPVSGELSDPQFDFSAAIGQAVAGAVRNTASTLLSVVFPVVPLFEAVQESETRRALDLKPLDYPLGSAAINDAQRTYLGNLAKLLGGRPALKINICGFAGPADWPAIHGARVAAAEEAAAPKTSVGIAARQAGGWLRSAVGAKSAPPPPPPEADPDALNDLAAERSRTVKAYLAESGGIAEARLFECRPEVETDGAAKPRVEVRF